MDPASTWVYCEGSLPEVPSFILMAPVIPSTYAKPPIVEALVELRFVPGQPWGDKMLEGISARLREHYPGEKQTRNRFELQANLQKDAMATASRVMFHQVLFPADDGKALVGVGENFLTVHVLAPYPGWSKFVPRVTAALNIYRDEARPEGIELVAVRYIDQIAIPAESNLSPVITFPGCHRGPRPCLPCWTGFTL